MIEAFRRRLVGAALAFVAFLAVGSATAQTPPPLTVFAAASLKNAMDDVGKAYTARTGALVRFSYAASSVLAQQIEARAPADVFVSADGDWMDYLAQRHLIAAASRRNLLANHLALIAPSDSKISIRIGQGMPLAQALGGGRLAIAGPDVPAGRYGRASLTALGVWPSVQAKLAPAESVRAALAFVARGETPLGVVYDTDAKVEPKVRIVGLFPDSSHAPIVYPAAVVAYSTDPSAVAFLRFLRGPEASKIFRAYGFITPGR